MPQPLMNQVVAIWARIAQQRTIATTIGHAEKEASLRRDGDLQDTVTLVSEEINCLFDVVQGE
jgi:hypothetical protein